MASLKLAIGPYVNLPGLLLVGFCLALGITPRLDHTTRNCPKTVRVELRPGTVVAANSELAQQAIADLKSGRLNKVWPLLRHTPDPTVRTYLIHNFAPSGVNPQLLINRLEVERDVSARRALILSLGEYRTDQLSRSTRHRLIQKLLLLNRTEADGGIHSAIEWLLRQPITGPFLFGKPEWRPAGRRFSTSGWYVNNEGHTMIVIREPKLFTMGSPPDEPGRTADETQHRVRIPRSFVVASKEVTVDQFQRFLEANPKLEIRYPDATKNPRRGSPVMQSHSPEGDCPQIAVTWYEAAQYCNWLSKRDGFPESEWVYPVDLSEIKSGMTLSANYLHRTGYRLLTEAEWEFVARAGATTSRFYGSSDEILDRYAVYSKNPPRRKGDPNDPNDPQRTARVGQLKPNDLGFFDIYGNVWEWIHDRRIEYPFTYMIREDIEDSVLVVNDQQWRMRRGGSYSYDATVMRSAHRGRPDGYVPNERRDSVGFRVARTLRP